MTALPGEAPLLPPHSRGDLRTAQDPEIDRCADFSHLPLLQEEINRAKEALNSRGYPAINPRVCISIEHLIME